MKTKFLSILAATALLASCDGVKKADTENSVEAATADTAVVVTDTSATLADVGDKAGNAVENAWDMTKAKLANIKYPEINLSGISLRGDDNYNVYGVDEKVLFDTDKAVVKASAGESLQQIAASINQRYGKNDVRIMGFTDSRGDKDYNKELSEQRAEAVRQWFVQNGKIADSRISVESMGEAAPVASNATASGRQENRRVEIAVRTK